LQVQAAFFSSLLVPQGGLRAGDETPASADIRAERRPLAL